MQVYCDLHMHSCLSPCGDDDMTPWNLVGMAKVKGLAVIALTDHNTALNVPAAMAAGRAYGVQVIPGMEVASREEVHVLAYFPTAKAALDFGDIVYAHLPDMENHADLFGNQIIRGLDDEPAGSEKKLLISATDLTLAQIGTLVRQFGGIDVPAHINRGANSMIVALGLMPPLPQYPVVEAVAGVACPPEALRGRFVLRSSDAHQLCDIAEKTFALELPEPTARAVFELLQSIKAD
ncbi:MAG: PHP domain-containing protein [Eubacteriales bacterium]|nr:PHP domain-containing protein [Eubacteriales bacterium]